MESGNLNVSTLNENSSSIDLNISNGNGSVACVVNNDNVNTLMDDDGVQHHQHQQLQKPALLIDGGGHKDWLWRKLELDCGFNVDLSQIVVPQHLYGYNNNNDGQQSNFTLINGASDEATFQAKQLLATGGQQQLSSIGGDGDKETKTSILSPTACGVPLSYHHQLHQHQHNHYHHVSQTINNGEKLLFTSTTNNNSNSNKLFTSSVATNRVCLALCGLGRMGTIHLMNILKNPHVKLLYCCDANLARLEYIARTYHFDELGIIRLSSTNVNVAFEDQQVDGVIVCTPTSTHEFLCQMALQCNKQVLCEKPLAFERESIENLYSLARERNLLLGLAFNRRYDPSLLDLKRRVELGEIGQLQVIKTCSRDSPAPPIEYIRTSGGIFHDCIIHDVDLMIWLARDLPVQVSVFAHSFNEQIRETGDYDTVSIQLKFRSGILGLIDVSRSSAYGYDQRCEVFGSKGMLRVEDIKPIETKSHRAEGIVQAPIRYCFASRYHDSYIIELDDFVAQVARRQGKLLASNCIPLTDNMSRPKTVLALHKIMDTCEVAAHEHRLMQLEWNSEIEE